MSQPGHSAFIFIGSKYMSPLGTSLSSQLQFNNVDTTNFASGGMFERKPTTIGAVASMNAFIDETITVGDFESNPAGVTQWLTHAYRVPQAGDVFHSFIPICTSANQIGGEVGGVWQGSLSFESYDKYVLTGQGTNTGGVLFWGTTTATADGSSVQFGTMSAGETLYAFLHVDAATIAGTTPTLDIIVERSATGAWAGEESTVYTFTQVTDLANWHQVKNSESGVQAEEYYRVGYTVAGAGASFKWFCGLAIATN